MTNCIQCSPDPSLGSFIPELKNTMKRLEAEYESNGTITWSEYSVSWDQPAWNQAADDQSRQDNAKKVILLTQNDFKNGTLRITTPCKLLFTEDVMFNANAGTPLPGPAIDPNRALDWFPDPAPYTNVPDNEQYQQGDYANGYRLGFFAGIAIESEGVIVDLNGYSYQANDEFNLMQRFFALFTLNDQPLPPGEGPGDFGGQLRPGKKVWIKNGKLGTSHHNIQGNGNRDIWLQDLIMKNHEVAAVSLNGAKRVLVESCEDLGSKPNIPVLGNFSAMRFAIRSGEKVDDFYGAGTVDAVLINGGNALTRAKASVDRIFNDVIYNNGGVIDSSLASGVPAHAIFQNWKKDAAEVEVPGTGLLDGPAYSMNFTPSGVAVGDFLEEYGNKNGEACDIVIDKCKLNSIVNSIVEVPATPNKDTGARTTNVDAMPIQLTNVYLDDDGNPQSQRDPGTGAYVGGSLLDLTLALADIWRANPADQTNKDLWNIWALVGPGATVPDTDIIAWAKGNGDLLEFQIDPATDRRQLKFSVAGTTYLLIYAGDGLHHVIKGCTPLRMDGITRFLVRDTTVWGARAEGPDSSGFYLDSSDGGNQLGMTHKGNWSGRVQCIRLSTCADGALVGVMIRDGESYWNQCLGLEIAGESANITVQDCRVANMKAGTQRTETTSKELNDAFGVPNPVPLARGVKIESQAKNICLGGTKVDTIESYENLRTKEEPVEFGSGCVVG